MIAEWTVFATPAMLWVTMLSVALVGLSKGGLGGAFAMMGVPVMSLVMPPLLAAAVLLPILLMMDALSLWYWRGWANWRLLRSMLPAAVVGITLGWATAELTSEAMVRLIIGAVALGFAARAAVGPLIGVAMRHRPGLGWFWGGFAGFTSFVAHAGGPPFQVHVLPAKMAPKLYTGTSVKFFAIVNAIKLLPYGMLGMFEGEVVVSALVMLPLAIVAVSAGAAIIKRMPARVFYPFSYAMIAVVGVKLIYDGIGGL
ncbi:sulfite exporter TauE/SafE family protein [Pararhodobacter oceanensis]|uniref:sulfite exporter TauE/SafE family protein n=1 Tax=Pararhodobacter oceanensis TaxID=2172121 RepID=UPI003A9171EF